MSLTQYVNKVLEGTGRKSLFSLIFSLEGLKMFADGNIGYIKLFKGYTQGELVGEDHFGNRYYENNELGYGRKRWMVPKDTINYNVSGVPAEWHGWLNQINDYPPTRYEYKKPKYAVQSYITRTGTPDAYGPKGSWGSLDKRNWQKLEAWQPPKQA